MLNRLKTAVYRVLVRPSRVVSRIFFGDMAKRIDDARRAAQEGRSIAQRQHDLRQDEILRTFLRELER